MLSRLLVALCFLLTIPMNPVLASSDLPMPSGDVILTVSGRIDKVNDGSQALLTLAMMREVGVTGYETRSPWLTSRARFKGVLLRDVLTLLGAEEGSDIVARAADDYAVTIPWSDVADYDVLLAFEVNGVTLTRRDKGPLWVVYPLDENPELDRTEITYRWIWQLESLDLQ